MIRTLALSGALALCAAIPSAAYAGELFGGVYAHGVDTPLSFDTGERGADIELGWRGGRIAVLDNGDGPAPYVFGSVNTAGDTNFVAAGLAWKVGLSEQVYVRPGVGLSYNDGPALRLAADGTHTELGSHVLFEPEIGLGIALSDRASVEASWVHISGARLFNNAQNPGIDMIGVRVNWRL